MSFIITEAAEKKGAESESSESSVGVVNPFVGLTIPQKTKTAKRVEVEVRFLGFNRALEGTDGDEPFVPMRANDVSFHVLYT